MSLTITGLLITVLSLIFPVDEVNLFVESMEDAVLNITTAVGLILTWYGRYRKGDLSVFGFRK